MFFNDIITCVAIFIMMGGPDSMCLVLSTFHLSLKAEEIIIFRSDMNLKIYKLF